MKTCPCGTKKEYESCCGVFISQQKNPTTPEELMRSRYTAYSLAKVEYILATMKSPAADGFNLEDARDWAKKVTWLGLDVIKSSMKKNKGTVEFVARYAENGQESDLHEISEFTLVDGKWYYTDSLHACC